MTRRLTLLLMLLLAATLGAPEAHAQRLRVAIAEGLSCHVTAPFADPAFSGNVVPLKLQFANGGPEREIRVVLESYGSVSAVFSVRGEGSSTRWLYVPVPGDALYGATLKFYDDRTGELLKGWVWGNLRLSRSGAAPGTVAYTISGPSDDMAILVVAGARAPALPASLTGSSTLSVSRSGPGDLPDSWLGLCGFNVIVATAEAWASSRMDTGPVLDWVAMGGLCLIVGATPEEQQAAVRQIEERLPLIHHTDGTVWAGMGCIRFVREEEARQLPLSDRRMGVRRNVIDVRAGRDSWYPPLRVDDRPPFASVLVILISFSLLVGPLGWWYVVGKKKRPLVYYVVAPLASLSVVVAVIVADMVAQGFRPWAACVATELLDQRAQRRVTMSQFAVYCPSTMGRRLRGAPDELPGFLSLSQGDLRGGYSPFGLGGLRVLYALDGPIYDGALPARAKAWYCTQRLRLARERLEVWKENGRIHVENHLGAPLRNVVVAYEGEYAAFERLAEGEGASADPMAPAEAARRCRDVARTGPSQFAGTFVSDYGPAAMHRRWQQAFDSAQNAFIALRDGKYEELIWLDSVRFSYCNSIIRGVF